MMRVEMTEEGEHIESRRLQRRGTEGPSKRERERKCLKCLSVVGLAA